MKVGLPRDIATLLAAQTTFGAAKMVLETGYHPALLKDAVTTPAGCTIDGILELEEGGLRVTLIKAVMRATQRAKELAGWVFPGKMDRPMSSSHALGGLGRRKPTSRPSDLLPRFAWGVLVYNVAGLLWGALVRATGSGAGCGDHWPLCNGVVVQSHPRLATSIELAHRMTAGVTVIAVLLLLVWIFRPHGCRASGSHYGHCGRGVHLQRIVARRPAGAVAAHGG